MTTKIYMVRHGETGWAEAKRYAGRADIPLSEKGIMQAEKLAVAMATETIDVCFTSPLQRCVHTAQIITRSHGLELMCMPEFMELDFGVWDGLLDSEIKERYAAQWQLWEKDPAARAPQSGESGYQLAARAIPALFNIIEEWREHTILLVAHKTVIRILLCHLMNIPIKEYRQSVPQETTALNEVHLNNGRFRVQRINDVAHLNC